MGDGFKLLDAYVEVKADATGIGEKVSKAFAGEIAPAAKKMADAVETATSRVAAASKRQEDAAASLKLAQMRLNDVQKTAEAGSTALVSAQERVAAAQRNVAAASASAERAQKSLSTAQSSLQDVGQKAGGGFLSGLGGMLAGGAVAGLVSGLVSTVASGVTSVIGGTISDVEGMLVTVGRDVASTVINFNSELQNADIGFTTMLGSGKKAQTFLNQLQDFAKSTPFEFGNLVHNAQSMMGMGIAAKDVIPDLTALGDSVAAMGGSASQVDSVTLAFDQMNAKGTLDMGNMNQLMENGVPSALKVMASAYHVTTGKMIELISTGKVQANVALPALVKGIEKGTKSTAALGGMMDKQSSTFTGALSNIQDGFTQIVSKTFKPFFDVVSKGMQRFATALGGKDVQKFADTVTRLLRPLADGIGKWFSHIDFGKIFATAGKILGQVGKAIQSVFGDPKVKKSIDGVGKSVGDAFKSIGPTLGKAMPSLVSFAKDVFPAIADAVAAVIKKLPELFKWWGQVAKMLADAGPTIAGVIGFLSDFTGTIFDASVNVKNFLVDTLNTVTGMQKGWDQAMVAIAGFGDGIKGYFKDAGSWLAGVGKDLVDGLVNGVKGAWHFVTDAVNSLTSLIPEGVRKMLGIASPSKVFHLIGTQVGQGLHLGLLGTVDQIKTTSAKMVDAIHSAFSGAKGAAMVRGIDVHAKALERLSLARDKANGRLSNAKSVLNGLLNDRSQFAAGVKSNVMGGADVAGLFSASPTVQAAMAGTLGGQAYQGSWTTTASSGLANVKASLKKLLSDTKAFGANLGKLVKLGIDPATYDELVQAGVRGGGLETAAAMVADPTMARSIFSLEGQIGKAGAALGAQAGGHEYAGQISAAQRNVARDQRTLTQINLTMVVEAKKIDEVSKLIKMVNGVKQTARAR